MAGNKKIKNKLNFNNFLTSAYANEYTFQDYWYRMMLSLIHI